MSIRTWILLLACVASTEGGAFGQFESRARVPLGATVPSAAAVGDFNRDGKLDVAVIEYLPTGTVGILLGNGDGPFISVRAMRLRRSLCS